MNNEQLAKICYATNVAYNEVINEKSLSWEECKDSIIKSVEYTLKHSDATAQDIHSEWFHNKLMAGWKYGPVEDVENKQHPCMLEWNRLSSKDKYKDVLLLSIVRALKSGRE